MELGADDYITKPFDPEEILRLIKARIKKSIDLKKFHENNLEELRKNIAISLPHELRTPLTVILGFAEILKTGYHSLSEEEVIEISDSITDSGNRLLRLIANYSHYVELVNLESFSGKVQFKGVVSAERVIIETSETIAYKYNRLKDLEFDIQDSHVHIFESHLMKMIEHLVDNSFKFSESGSKVKITAFPEKELFHIKITNTSFGISDEDISKIGAFMQFNRGSYEQQGTGLGLSIAKKTASVYNGTFAVNCTPEREVIVSINLLID
jgi:K+-sensing histidine kinase KdpD